MVLQEASSDLDGAPMDNTLIDGLPLDGESVDHLDGCPMGWDPLDGAPVDDIDGIPLGAAIDDIDGMPCECTIPVLSLMFICTTCVRMVCIHIGCCSVIKLHFFHTNSMSVYGWFIFTSSLTFMQSAVLVLTSLSSLFRSG